jgi:NADH dehydrogenase
LNNEQRIRLGIGIGAGILGGVVYALVLNQMGMFASITEIFRLRADLFGWAVHLVISGVIGGIYGLIFVPSTGPARFSDGLANGTLYGIIWWSLGALTLASFLRTGQPAWTMAAAVDAYPALIGHILYGLVLSLTYQVIALPLIERLPLAREGVAIKHRVIILGGGFGGIAAAMEWEKRLRRHPEIAVTLISDSNYSLFTPMLAEAAAGSLEPAHISSSVRSFFKRVQFRRAAVTAIDLEANNVTLKTCDECKPISLPFDQILVAMGSISYDFGLPGIAQYAYTLKTLQDAILLRDHVITLLELADAAEEGVPPGLLTFVVAGGGFSGMEIVAELFDFVHHALPYYPRIKATDTRFILVHSGAGVLPELSSSLGEYALQKLSGRGIEFLLNTRVAGCTANSVLIKDKEPITAQTLVWTTGNKVHPVVSALDVAKDGQRLKTDPTLRSTSHPALWAVGDCAANPAPDGKLYAPTAQNASRSGKKAADNMFAVMHGRPAEPFVFKPLGLLVVLGQRTAAAEIGSQKFSGLLAWLLWRGIYLSKLPGLEKKVRVLIDWVVEFFFPRDLVLTQRVSAPDRVDPMPERAQSIPTPTIQNEAAKPTVNPS